MISAILLLSSTLAAGEAGPTNGGTSQTSNPPVPPAVGLPDCRSARPNQECRIRIERDSPLAGNHVTVRNRTIVHFLLTGKDPFETCKLESKRTELPQGTAIPDLLALIGAAGGALVLHPSPSGAPGPTRTVGPLEGRVRALLDRVIERATNDVTRLDAVATKYRTVRQALDDFFGTRFRRTTFDGSEDSVVRRFHDQRLERLGQVTALLNEMPKKENPIPSTAALDDLYATAIIVFRQYEASTEAAPRATLELVELMQAARGNIDLLKEAVERFRAGRAALAETKNYLEHLEKATWEFTSRLTSDQNARLNGTVSCSSTRGEKVSLEPVVWAVTFQDPPRLSLSAGFLVTPLPKQKAFVGSIATDRTEANAVTPVSTVQQTSTAPQVLPMTLIQIRLNEGWNWNGRVVTFNFTPAVGINLNNKEAEFFAGLSIGFGNLYISGGGHFGHLEEPGGDFEVGDRPTASVSTLPLARPWTTRLAAALSYRVPLK